MGSLYNRVKVNNPGHSFFNLSHDKKFDCDMGQLIPIDVKFCMPGDVLKFGNEIVARMNPLVSPVMHEINIYTQYFFVPFRIMFGYMKSHTYPGPNGTETVKEWEVNDHDFETFLTGGKTGYDTSVSLPTISAGGYGTYTRNDNCVHDFSWDDANSVFKNSVKIDSGVVLVGGQLYYYRDNGATVNFIATDGETRQFDVWTPLYVNEYVGPTAAYSLWDYLGFPVHMVPGVPVSAFPLRAYALVWNNFFRDQTLMDEIDVINNRAVKNVCWNKDYFTSAYVELQRGQSPALPLSNSLLPVFVDVDASGIASDLDHGQILGLNTSTSAGSFAIGSKGSSSYLDASGSSRATTGFAQPLQVDASGLFNVNDLRLAMRVQEWLEINNRVGNHLNEFLIGHFGVGPHDETLQRPVYLGGSKSPVIVSEVLQTSSTDATSPQGNMAGHGISADRNYIGSYHCKEFGVFMGLMYIRPKATYQQGVDKTWLYQTKYDFPFPEFCHLGNNAIWSTEVYSDGANDVDADGNPVIFGYTERYNELRSSHSEVCGGLRNTFDFWHLGRKFDSCPNYNADFVRCVPSKRIFAVESEPGFIVNVGNMLHAYRPIPTFGDPRT